MALQTVDSELQRLENLRGDLPQQVAMLNAEVKDIRERLHNEDESLQGYKIEKADIELEIKSLQDRTKKYQDQLYEVKNNREYDAVTLELESVKDDIDKKESRLLELMSLEEESTKKQEVLSNSLSELESQLKDREENLKQRMVKTEGEESVLTVKRKSLIKGIEPRLLSSYDRIRKAKNGLAVAPIVRDGCCGGCFKQLPPQRVMEIRDMDRLILCEVCGRILIWDEERAKEHELEI